MTTSVLYSQMLFELGLKYDTHLKWFKNESGKFIRYRIISSNYGDWCFPAYMLYDLNGTGLLDIVPYTTSTYTKYNKHRKRYINRTNWQLEKSYIIGNPDKKLYDFYYAGNCSNNWEVEAGKEIPLYNPCDAIADCIYYLIKEEFCKVENGKLIFIEGRSE